MCIRDSIKSFFEDLEPSDMKVFDLDYLENSEIDFLCLNSYNELSDRKKRRKKFNCFNKCSDVLFKELVISNSRE